MNTIFTVVFFCFQIIIINITIVPSGEISWTEYQISFKKFLCFFLLFRPRCISIMYYIETCGVKCFVFWVLFIIIINWTQYKNIVQLKDNRSFLYWPLKKKVFIYMNIRQISYFVTNIINYTLPMDEYVWMQIKLIVCYSPNEMLEQ
jgi:hypothetical protein